MPMQDALWSIYDPHQNYDSLLFTYLKNLTVVTMEHREGCFHQRHKPTWPGFEALTTFCYSRRPGNKEK